MGTKEHSIVYPVEIDQTDVTTAMLSNNNKEKPKFDVRKNTKSQFENLQRKQTAWLITMTAQDML